MIKFVLYKKYRQKQLRNKNRGNGNATKFPLESFCFEIQQRGKHVREDRCDSCDLDCHFTLLFSIPTHDSNQAIPPQLHIYCPPFPLLFPPCLSLTAPCMHVYHLPFLTLVCHSTVQQLPLCLSIHSPTLSVIQQFHPVTRQSHPTVYVIQQLSSCLSLHSSHHICICYSTVPPYRSLHSPTIYVTPQSYHI
jgi:hypothetical protein